MSSGRVMRKCLFCQSDDEVQDHHAAPEVLDLTVPLCKQHCHFAQTDRQYRAGVFRALKSGSEIGEAWSVVAGFSGLLIELARASGAEDLVECYERQRHSMFRLLSALDHTQTGPAPVLGGLRKRREPTISLNEGDAVRAAQGILDALHDGACQWLGECPQLPELAPDADFLGLMGDQTAVLESLAQMLLTGEEPDPRLISKLKLQSTERTG